LRERAKTLIELADNAAFYAVDAPIAISEPAAELLARTPSALFGALCARLAAVTEWREEVLEQAVRSYAEEQPDRKLGQLAQPLRAALTGFTVSPPLFEVLRVLGRKEALERLDVVLNTTLPATIAKH
jgi:glutamyl-tRNA synthetase